VSVETLKEGKTRFLVVDHMHLRMFVCATFEEFKLLFTATYGEAFPFHLFVGKLL